MPVVRVNEPESEALTNIAGVGTGEVARVTTNLRLSGHIGQFVASEVATQYCNEDLAATLKGKNMFMISGSWG